LLLPRLAKLNKFISTFFYVGFLRPAPGTWGSISAIVLAYIILITMGFLTFFIILIFTIIIGFWSTKNYIKNSSEKSDPSEVVIDEVIGQWIAILPLGYILEIDEFIRDGLWFVWLWAFVSFRFFDIIKLGLIGWADNLGGALGVLLDDILAGIAAGLTVAVLVILI
jgi:phosphatidylglycerophosphatase A